MAINTEFKRMQQLTGKWKDLDTTNMVVGEIAVPDDHNPVVKTANNKIKEIALLEDMDEYEKHISDLTQAVESATNIVNQYDEDVMRIAQSEANAKASEDNAKTSETNAETNANLAISSANSALESAESAKDALDSAIEAEAKAKASEESAKTSEDNAKASEDKAKEYAENLKDIIDDTKVSTTTTYSSDKLNKKIGTTDISDVGDDVTEAIRNLADEPKIPANVALVAEGTTEATDEPTHLTSSDIADNLVTSDSTKVLSARQGKVLNDKVVDVENDVETLNNDIVSKIGNIIKISGQEQYGLLDIHYGGNDIRNCYMLRCHADTSVSSGSKLILYKITNGSATVVWKI